VQITPKIKIQRVLFLKKEPKIKFALSSYCI